jgi:hypothetical protein
MYAVEKVCKRIKMKAIANFKKTITSHMRFKVLMEINELG